MQASLLAKNLKATVAAEVGRLKMLRAADLVALGRLGKSTIATFGDKQFEITTWSEPVAHNAEGLCVVLVGAQQPRWCGGYTHHLQGFVVRQDEACIDLTESELWHYD